MVGECCATLNTFYMIKHDLSDLEVDPTLHLFNYITGITIDALPTPWRTQMWIQAKDSGRGRSRDTLLSSQHFEG
jgi:hypothetical protein